MEGREGGKTRSWSACSRRQKSVSVEGLDVSFAQRTNADLPKFGVLERLFGGRGDRRNLCPGPPTSTGAWAISSPSCCWASPTWGSGTVGPICQYVFCVDSGFCLKSRRASSSVQLRKGVSAGFPGLIFAGEAWVLCFVVDKQTSQEATATQLLTCRNTQHIWADFALTLFLRPQVCTSGSAGPGAGGCPEALQGTPSHFLFASEHEQQISKA